MEGDRELGETLQAVLDISIHSLRMEGDLPNVIFRKSGALHFNPLPPHGGRLGKVLFVEFVSLFQSTPSAWRETTSKIILHQPFQPISIHSLRMEGDRRYAGLRSDTGYFNPLPPHGGRPVQTLQRKKSVSYFNPLPPHGGRLDRCKTSIKYKMEFQSTPSAWRETYVRKSIVDPKTGISIHSLRMEGDAAD